MNTEEIIKELEELRDKAAKDAEYLEKSGDFRESDIYYNLEIAYADALEIIKKHTEEKK